MMKERLDDQTMALRVASELQDGWYVNLGFGIPTLVANLVPEGKEVIFVSENGIIGFSPIISREEASAMGWKYVDASAQPVAAAPGMAIVDYAKAFDIIRGGRLDLKVPGGLQISEHGDLAKWRLPIYKGLGGTIGGASSTYSLHRTNRTFQRWPYVVFQLCRGTLRSHYAARGCFWSKSKCELARHGRRAYSRWQHRLLV